MRLLNGQESSRGGLEVGCPLSIQLKAGHYCLDGSNPAWELCMVKSMAVNIDLTTRI